jgi:serine/threonine protein phosphatase PrpC
LGAAYNLKKRFFDIGVVSDAGDRKKINEDCVLVKTNYVRGEEIGIFVVADGMSGLADGKSASNLTVELISYWWENYFLTRMLDGEYISSILDNLDQAIDRINHQLFNYPEKRGTTMSLMIIIGDIYIIRHVGDSRVYCINKSIRMASEDHIYAEELYKKGYIQKDDPAYHSQRHLLTRCLGVKKEVEVFKDFDKTKIGDIYLLCSDGFHAYVNEPDILKILYDKRIFTMQDKAKELRKLIKAGAANDNISIMLIRQAEREDELSFSYRVKQKLSSFMDREGTTGE